ncbi:MAG: GGDEF domain-containing protein, partial [Pseudohongiella sp.]|nr:GGDEF domain-containing protein [Pseudohongiella sp.]
TIAHFTLRSYQRKLEDMATKDRLTGVANRHLFEMIFEHLTRNMQRYPRPVSIISVDIDYFKMVNDNFGHQAGDLVLREVCQLIIKHIRDSDTICRWGGEEFVLLLDYCQIDEAVLRAREIQAAIQNLAVPFGKSRIKVTLSMGIADYRSGEALDVLMARADTALYKAKKAGRNCIVCADAS